MQFTPTAIKDVLVITTKVFKDPRGFFMETYRRDACAAQGINADFVQINHSQSVRNTLRGLHYQVGHPQGKLVRVLRGEVFDVVVDIRFGSPTFGRWIGEVLSAQNKKQLFVPIGCAHGFCVLSDEAEFLYYCTDYYYPPGEKGIIWNDPDLNIPWPTLEPLLSEKDRRNPCFRDIARDFNYNC
ncbi:MAG: dTDP-4-dehydrorhamnose 3,5-epimerase [Verrucomicrobiota bacterium]